MSKKTRVGLGEDWPAEEFQLVDSDNVNSPENMKLPVISNASNLGVALIISLTVVVIASGDPESIKRAWDFGQQLVMMLLGWAIGHRSGSES